MRLNQEPMKSIKIILLMTFIASLDTAAIAGSTADVGIAPAITTLRIPAPRSDLDTSSSYHIQLLQMALARAADGRELPALQVTMPMEQGRAAHELALGRSIDIFWMGADKQRSRMLHMIPIPLERGLIGYRQFIVHKKRLAEFEQVKSVKALSQFTACQGAQWPDADILRDANLPVVTSTGYEQLFKQVAAGRCDYFPRGFHEINIEMAKRGAAYPELTIADSAILHYPYGIYFFVKKDNKQLADWIERGLQQLIDDGELIRHMQTHQHTSRAFPLMTSHHRHLISIPNEEFPAGQDTSNKRYWFQPEDFASPEQSPSPK
jgi:hypothetical protein